MIHIFIAIKVYNPALAGCRHHPMWPLVLPLDLSYTLPVYLLLFSVNLPYGNFKHCPCSNLISNFICLGYSRKIHPSVGPCVTFHNKLVFRGEELLAPCPTSKLEDHPLLALCNWLFNIFAATEHIWRLSPLYATQEHTPCHGDRNPHNMEEQLQEVITNMMCICY